MMKWCQYTKITFAEKVGKTFGRDFGPNDAPVNYINVLDVTVNQSEFELYWYTLCKRLLITQQPISKNGMVSRDLDDLSAVWVLHNEVL